GLPVPTSERQARELGRVPEAQRAEVWRQAGERTGGKPTAVAVRETAAQYAVPAAEFMTNAEARDVTDAICAHLDKVDRWILDALDGGVAPITVIGQLSVMLLDFNEKLGEEAVDPIRRHFVEPAIRSLVALYSDGGDAS
ncbi:hypothetical protein, partial [Streptomyces sp. NPDC059063]